MYDARIYLESSVSKLQSQYRDPSDNNNMNLLSAQNYSVKLYIDKEELCGVCVMPLSQPVPAHSDFTGVGEMGSRLALGMNISKTIAWCQMC